jgi:hypothetical protein
MTVTLCRSDNICGQQLRTRIDVVAQQLHRQDTNPNNPGNDDGDGDGAGVGVRTWEQLRHDALMILLGIHTHGTTTTNNGNGNGSGSGSGSGGDGDDVETEAGLTADVVFKPAGSVRNQIVVVVDADVISGRNPDGRCEIPGIGPIPTSVLQRLACDADIFGHIFNGDGVSLWHSRATRTVSPQQWRALIARDRGCVLCAAAPNYCEAHHIIEWSHHGPTNIENLALLCAKHHHQLHDTNHQLTRHAPNQWHTQPRTGPDRPNPPNQTRAGPARTAA